MQGTPFPTRLPSCPGAGHRLHCACYQERGLTLLSLRVCLHTHATATLSSLKYVLQGFKAGLLM